MIPPPRATLASPPIELLGHVCRLHSHLRRLYFSHGGLSMWAFAIVQSVCLPLPLIPPPRQPPRRRPTVLQLHPLAITVCLGVGLLTGLNKFLISWGIFYIPVSTSSLFLSSQLTFNLALSILLDRQKVRFSNLNYIILITLAFILIALGSSSFAPPGISATQYFLGFFPILGATLLFIVYLPLMEIVPRTSMMVLVTRCRYRS